MFHGSMSRLALAAVFACALTAPLSAADPAPRGKDKAVSPGERIRTIFDQKITIDVTEQPLALALNQLREQTKINFVLDRFTLQQMGMDPEGMPVNVKLKDEKVSEALKKIVKPYNLSHAIIGDTVFISTNAMTMDRQLRQHVTVDVDKVEVATALKQLAKETSTNIVLDGQVGKAGQTVVTLQMEDVPLETAVRLLAEMAGLRAVRENNSNVLNVKPRSLPNELLPVGPKVGKADRADGTSSTVILTELRPVTPPIRNYLPPGQVIPPDDPLFEPPAPKDGGKKP
jgi:predicted transcriptional regulator